MSRSVWVTEIKYLYQSQKLSIGPAVLYSFYKYGHNPQKEGEAVYFYLRAAEWR